MTTNDETFTDDAAPAPRPGPGPSADADGANESAETPWSDEQHLLTFVRDRDAPCPNCGYNVRGLARPTCPECGEALRLTVGAVHGLNKAWVTATVTTSVGAGLGLFFLAMLVVAGRPHIPSAMGTIAFYGFLSVGPPAAGALLFWRRKFQRLARPVQTRLAIAAVVAVGTAFVMLIGSLGP